jgi:hypothetical protein
MVFSSAWHFVGPMTAGPRSANYSGAACPDKRN